MHGHHNEMYVAEGVGFGNYTMGSQLLEGGVTFSDLI